MLPSIRLVIILLTTLAFCYFLWVRSLVYDSQRILDSITASGTHLHLFGFGNTNYQEGSKGEYVLGDLADLVNVFIGTTSDGHVFPGATIPHGMAKPGMDTDSPGGHAGYDALPRYLVTGFSQLHDDGTGGQIPLSNFKLFPIQTCLSFTTCDTSIWQRKISRALNKDGTPMDEGSPGYFKTTLENGIQVELTATRRTALHRYTFLSPDHEGTNDTSPRILIDVTNEGQHSGRNPSVTIVPETGRVSGGARFIGSFGGGAYEAFFCADFTSPSTSPATPLIPIEYGTYDSSSINPNQTTFPTYEFGEQGVLLTFPRASPTSLSGEELNQTTTIIARVGVSFISPQQACTSASEEISTFDFEDVRSNARKQWVDLLGTIEVDLGLHGDEVEVEGRAGSEDEIDQEMRSRKEDAVLFYSSLYRSHIVPADYSEENPHWFSTVPYYDSLYCNWDTYRTLYPLYSLHNPYTYARIVQSFIDIQQHEGWLPECRDTTLQQYIQGGTSGDPILAEFYVKFRSRLEELDILPENIWDALVKDAEVESPTWDFMGRQAEVWKELGYLPVGDYSDRGGMNTRQVSRTLEYAFDDFTISQVARYMNKSEDHLKYQNRSRGFELVWNPETVVLSSVDAGDSASAEEVVEGIKGFMQPRDRNGTFVYTDPRHCTIHDPTHSTCFLDASNYDGFYEGSPIVYSQYVPHDTAKLIEMQGGNEAFIRRLDFIFDNGYFDSTNEPSQQIPFMYHYANKPGLSTERSRQIINESYNISVNGLPGNDDSGAMGSYVVFNLLGLYPLPATHQFLITSPFFPKITLRNPLFKTTTTIIAHGFRGNPKSGKGGNLYIKSIRVNGTLWNSNCYLDWETFVRGGRIDLELSDDRDVGCGGGGIPPSMSTGGYPFLPNS